MKIRALPQFTRDLKKMLKKNYKKSELEKVLILITEKKTEELKRKYKDHSLQGNWKG